MKLAGIKVSAKYTKEVTFYRETENFVFKLEAVGNYKDFEESCSQPLPPVITKPGGNEYQNIDDKEYIERLEEWSAWRIHWMAVNTIKEVEWDTVTTDPETYENWQEDLRNAGFSQIEVSKLQNHIMIVNGLIEPERIDEALKNSSVGKEAAPATD